MPANFSRAGLQKILPVALTIEPSLLFNKRQLRSPKDIQSSSKIHKNKLINSFVFKFRARACRKLHRLDSLCAANKIHTIETSPVYTYATIESRGWCSGESTRLPPMWPGFDFRSRRHMWVEFAVGSLFAPRGFSPGTPVFPSPQKPTF